ncbi:tRNA (adenine(22)-N(1))-methyltransferase TrmK [Pseudomonas sp. TH15]|nr:class I SAM-dependent methyltransferase [Pseudomonas sp. TH15]MBK5511640.1 tRNA (adenine(22)-N(1))-methyltransferase TrmK [Pseudomonas sp. TH15]
MPGVARQSRTPLRPQMPQVCVEQGLPLNEQTLSMRLERVAAHVPAGARLADIGSDHGYLPVALMRRGVIAAAVAGEVALTPFRSAERTVRENGLDQQITVRLGNGLAAIEPGDGITAISICGMGGETIRDILDNGKSRLSGQERLILQPNGGEQPLRQWLMENGYRILCEELLRENRFDYEIIVAERAAAVMYTAEELYFGPLQMQARSPVFLAKWQRILREKQKTLTNFARARQAVPEEKVQDIARQAQWISELLTSTASIAVVEQSPAL